MRAPIGLLPLLLALGACTSPELRPRQRPSTAPAQTREQRPMQEFVAPDPNAPSVVLFGKTAARMDEVVRLVRGLGGVSAYEAFTEEEALQRISTVPRLRLVLFGGAVEEASRRRLRAHLAQHFPGVPTSEPGFQYPYSDENIVADVRAKLQAGGPPPPER